MIAFGELAVALIDGRAQRRNRTVEVARRGKARGQDCGKRAGKMGCCLMASRSSDDGFFEPAEIEQGEAEVVMRFGEIAAALFDSGAEDADRLCQRCRSGKALAPRS